MKILKRMKLLLLILMLIALGACQAEEVNNTENEPTKNVPTSTVPPFFSSPTPSPVPPTPTPTPLPLKVFVPRYMLPAPPSYPIMVLGTQCNYQKDSWNQQSAYMAYACPDLNVPLISVRFTSLLEDQTAFDLFGEIPGEGSILVPPGTQLIGYENLTIAGRLDNSEYAYMMIYETGGYVVSIEAFFPQEENKTLEEFFEESGDVVLNAFLEIMVGKINNILRPPEPTQMANDQQGVHTEVSHWLVTESDANDYYGEGVDMWGDLMEGTWISVGDDVDGKRESICRQFLDRTNADAPLVKFFNCIIHVGPSYDLNSILEARSYATPLESANNYQDPSIFYGVDLSNGHITLNAFVLKNEYLFHTSVETRVIGGQTSERLFNGFIDNFIYNVMLTNYIRFSPQIADTLLFKDLFYRSIDPEWSLIRFKDGQWDVTQYSGLLKVSLSYATSGPETLLLRWITEEDFEIITRVLFEPDRNFQRTGLVIYENRDNYIALLRAHSDFRGSPGNGIYLDHLSDTSPSFDDADYEHYGIQISSPNDVYLKLRRIQDVYTGYYSMDGETWILVGEHTSSIQPVSHGLLIGKSDTEIFAYYDFYELHRLE